MENKLVGVNDLIRKEGILDHFVLKKKHGQPKSSSLKG